MSFDTELVSSYFGAQLSSPTCKSYAFVSLQNLDGLAVSFLLSCMNSPVEAVCLFSTEGPVLGSDLNLSPKKKFFFYLAPTPTIHLEAEKPTYFFDTDCFMASFSDYFCVLVF